MTTDSESFTMRVLVLTEVN